MPSDNTRTPDNAVLTAPVYETIERLLQKPGPRGSRAFALVVDLGMLTWRLNDGRAADDETLFAPVAGGSPGLWELTLFPASQVAIDALDVRVDATEQRTYAPVRAVLTSGAKSGLVVDGITFSAGVRVLASETGATGGIYLTAAGAWARAPDMPAAAVITIGATVHVLEGSASNVGIWRMSAPTTGTVTVGTTAMGWEQAGGVSTLPVAGDWTGGPLTLADNRYYTATANGDGRIVLAINPTGHVVGAQALIYIAAATLADAASLVMAADLNVANSASFDPVLAAWVTITRMANGFVGSLEPRPALDVVLPTIVSATVEAATPTKLDVVYAERTVVRSVAGLTLSSPARTLAQDSGQGTTTHRYTISGGAFVGGEAGNLLASAGSLQDMNGNLCGALSQAYVNNAGVYVPSRMVGRYKASAVVQSGTITSWTDLSGNGNTLTQGTAGNRATYVATDAAILNKPSSDFDGTNDCYENLDLKIAGVDPTDLNSYTILAVARFDDYAGRTLFTAFPDSPATDFEGITIFGESGNLKLAGKTAAGNSRVATPSVAYHAYEFGVTQALRYTYIDNVQAAELGSGHDDADDTPPLLGMRMGRLGSTAFYFFDGRIAELIFCHGTLSGPERAAWDAYVASEYGL